MRSRTSRLVRSGLAPLTQAEWREIRTCLLHIMEICGWQDEPKFKRILAKVEWEIRE